MRTQRYAIMCGCFGACLVGLAFIAEIAPTGPRASDRATLRGSAAKFHADLVRLEEQVPAGQEKFEALWKAHLRTVDQALEQKDVPTAVRRWHDAYGAALASRRWEGMIEVGDAFFRIGEVAGTSRGSRPNARKAYLIALIRARRDASVDGVLRTAEAFLALDDRAVAEQCLRIAQRLASASKKPNASAQVRAFAQKLTERLVGLETPGQM